MTFFLEITVFYLVGAFITVTIFTVETLVGYHPEVRKNWKLLFFVGLVWPVLFGRSTLHLFWRKHE